MKKKHYVRPQSNVVVMEVESMICKSMYSGYMGRENWKNEESFVGGNGFVGPESGMAPAKENNFFEEDEE